MKSNRYLPTQIAKISRAIIVSIALAIAASPVYAADETVKNADQIVYHADVYSRLNPDGIMLMLGGYRRWSGPIDQEYGIPSSFRQLGMNLGVNPAYSQASVYGEWQPQLYARVRLQYDVYHYFGNEGALLSFPNAGSQFGKSEVDALSGQEESSWGQRVLLQPVVTAKAGPAIIRNTTDLGWYRFTGQGPYFHETEYDTLLKDNDLVLNNQTAVLMKAWKGVNGATLLIGPFYEITHAFAADLDRQRAGAQFYCSPVQSLWGFRNPRFYGQIGMNLQDRNRDDEAFLRAGFGIDF